MSKTSVLPAGFVLVGEIEGKGDLVVCGVVEGPIEIEGGLVIEEGGAVTGGVTATSVVVRGVLEGDVVARVSIRVEPTAMVVGEASAPRVNIVEGARVRGRVTMTGEPIVPVRRRRRAAAPSPEPVVAESVAAESVAAESVAAESVTAPSSPPPKPRRRKRRRTARKPPPPTIPTVQRQKARRKDRVDGPA